MSLKDLIHARKIHARKTVLLRAINLFGVFAIGHDARKTRVNMDVLIPYQLLVYCSHELLVQNLPKLTDIARVLLNIYDPGS